MSGTQLNFNEPIRDAITRVQFAPNSNNLLISSWDSSLRLFDVDSNELRLEAQTRAALIDCCFEDGFVGYSAGSDGSICSKKVTHMPLERLRPRRDKGIDASIGQVLAFLVLLYPILFLFTGEAKFNASLGYDLYSGVYTTIGKHDDLATCVEYSDETCQTITTGWDGKMLSWDSRMEKAIRCLIGFTSHVESISVNGFELLVATGSSVCKYDLRKLDGLIKEDFAMGISIRCVRSISCWDGFAVGSVDGRVTLQSNSDEMGFTFRCHPKTKNGKYHLAAVNDITFNPSVQGAIVTGDYEGHVIAWDSTSKKRLLELPRYPNSVASLSYNHTGEMVAIASSYTYQEANEIEDDPQIFIQEMDESHLRAAAAGSSSSRRYK